MSNAYITVKEEEKEKNLLNGANNLKKSNNAYYTENGPVAQNSTNGNNAYLSYGSNNYNKLQEMQNAGYKAYQNFINQQVSDASARLERGRKNIEDNYNNAYKELQLDNEASVKKLPENMAKLGLYGSGAGETAIANIRADYSKQLRDLMKDKNNALYDLDGQIEAVKQQGAQQIAQYYFNLMQSQPDLFLTMLDRDFTQQQYIDSRNDRAEDIAYRNKQYIDSRNDRAEDVAYRNKQFDYGVSVDNYNKMLNEAGLSASMGNYNPYAEIGLISQDRAKVLDDYVINNLFSGGSSKSSGTGSGSSKSSGTTSATDKQLLMSQVDTEISHWLYSPYNYDNTGYFYNGWNENTNPIYAARDKINNPEVVRKIKNDLIEAGYSADKANSMVAGYVKTINEQVARIEGKEN